MSPPDAVIWHDLECGLYRADLRLWAQLADDWGGAVLDAGAGTGRVTLELARRGHRVFALDIDAELLAALEERACALPGGAGVRVTAAVADVRDFTIDDARFALCVMPMQTIQLLGGAEGRRAFLGCARAHLAPDGVLAVAIAPEFDEFAWSNGDQVPLPDILELEGTIYSSQPTAVRARGAQVLLERRREVIDPLGGRRVSEDRIGLDIVSAETLIAEGISVGLRPIGTDSIAETAEHVGSQVVIFSA